MKYGTDIPIEAPAALPPIESMLDSRRIKLAAPPAKPVPIFTLAGSRISTAGNLTIISAQAKHGKSAAVGAMIAAAFQKDEAGDYLGFGALPANGKALVHFDTEQSPFDAWQLVARAMKRAGVATEPSNLRSYAVLDLSVADRLRAMGAELERAATECGGIHSVLIDGVGDLCVSVNDPAEVTGLVDEIRALAVRYSCPIICVLHENPAAPGNAGKTRGHLGSHLERKAESNLTVKKDPQTEVSVIHSNGKNRGPNIPESIAPRFTYCEKAGMHISCERPMDSKAEAKREEMLEEVRQIFNTPESIAGLSWEDIHNRIQAINGIQRSGARKRFDKLVAAGLLKKNTAGEYTR